MRDDRPPDDPAPDARAPVLARSVLEGVRRRDPAALEAFFEAYFDRVYGFVHRLLGERALAEDVTQEVFVKVHRAAHQLDPGRDPLPWLMVIAHNTCRDVWRSSAYRLGRRSTSIDAQPALEQRLPAASHPERELLGAEREALVRAAIQKLPEALRAPVLLHDYEGLDHERIAEILGIGYAAARKRYSRALAALGALLQESLG